jgi:putative Ig domain-containing protein
VGTVRTSATVAFTNLTPTGGAALAITSSNPAVATVPAAVTIPALSSTGAFDVTVLPVAGTSTISVSYLGVSRSAVLTVTAQTLFRITTPTALPNATVGQNYAGFIEACCGQGTPYSWSLVSGTVPAGLRFAGNGLRLTQTTGVTGVATRVETTTFAVRARDQAGNTATKTFTLSVDPALPLVITNQSDQLSAGQVGVAYAIGLFPGGGVPPWRWSLIGGTLPPGLSIQASPGRVLGTPTAAGSYTFTARVDDSSGQFATRQFSILVLT